MTRARSASWMAAVVLLACACVPAPPPARAAGPGSAPPRAAAAPRALPRTLYGVTADDVSGLGQLVASARHLPAMPATRIYFDVSEQPAYYAAAVRRLHPVSYLMGELLDSSDETSIGVAAYAKRVKAYLNAFGAAIDIWEIGNEVNGNWTGPYQVVAAKLRAAYQAVAARHLRTALTLYYNVGCGDGAGELSPLDFSRRYVPRAVRDGLTYVFLSYYEDACGGIRPSARTWTAYFRSLHALYPRARLGFGEIGLTGPVTARTMNAAKVLMRYYYGLPVRLPYYAGGYFWWYYAEDCLPYARKPMWRALSAAFRAEASAQRG